MRGHESVGRQAARRGTPIAAIVAGVALGAIAGCSDNSATGTEICNNNRDDDGDRLIDCRDPDCAGAAACLGFRLDAGATPTGDLSALPLALQTVVNALTMPASGLEFAVDVDGDGTKDNKLGLVFAALKAANANLELQKDIEKQLKEGKLIFLHEFFAPSLDEATEAEVLTHFGVDLDADPSDNFSGSEPFGLSTVTPRVIRQKGKITKTGQLTVGPGTFVAPVPLGPLYVVLTLKSARMTATVSKTGFKDGVLSGAIPITEMTTKLVPALVTDMNRQLKNPKTTAAGRKLLLLFDTDKDGTITIAEVLKHPLVGTILNSPDVDTDNDKKADAFSIGIGIDATTCKINRAGTN